MSDEKPFAWAKWQELLLKLFKKGAKTQIDPDTTTANAEHLMDAVYEGYGKSFVDLKYDSPDYDKLLHLEKNVYQFSAAKNYQTLRDLTDLLRNENKIRTYAEFKVEADKILTEYQGNWLRTEYNAAIAGSQMASKWVDIERGAKLNGGAVFLQYRTQEDDLVRESHRPLNRITRESNDPFWDTFYPPNGWNCRCTVVRLSSGKKTPQPEVNEAMANVEMPKIFQTNLSKTGMIFPKSSPYFIGCPKEVLQKALDLIPPKPKQ